MLNEKGFNAALKNIKATGDKLAESVHEAGLFAIAQANEHGNIGFGVRLMEALGRKHDAKRVEKWLCTFGKFGVKDGVLVFRKRKDIEAEHYDAMLEKANATPYWELTQQEHHVFRVDYLSMLKGIISKHQKAEALRGEGKEAEELNEGVLREVETILARYTQKPVAATPAAA